MTSKARPEFACSPTVTHIFFCFLPLFALFQLVLFSNLKEYYTHELQEQAPDVVEQPGTFDPLGGHAVSAWITAKLFNGTECRISTDFRCLGCGTDGHAFSTFLNCLPGRSLEKVVLKITLNRHFEHRAGKGYEEPLFSEVVSESKEASQRNLVLYERLIANASKNMQKHFCTPLAMVSVPSHFLNDTITKASAKGVPKMHKFCVKSLSWKEKMVTGHLAPFAEGRQSIVRLSPIQRQRMAQEMVAIFRHMYQRQVIHCDVPNHHFIFQNYTRLIDFSRVLVATKTTHAKKKDNLSDLFRNQLWQLFAHIIHRCNANRTRAAMKELSEKVPIQPNACRGDIRSIYSADFRDLLIASLKHCHVDKKVEPFTNEVMHDVDKMYQILAEWAAERQ